MGNIILNGKVTHAQLCDPQHLISMLHMLQLLVEEYGFVPEHGTMNIVVTAALWSLIMHHA